MTTVEAPETTTPDIGKLTTQANELRGAMVEALGNAEDDKVRKLSNELAAINRQILDVEVTTQGDARNAFLEAMHDALNTFEVPGFELTVKYDSNADNLVSAQYMLTGQAFDKIKATIAGIDRPSSATKWEYGWADGDDGKRYQSFEFSTARKRTSTDTSGNGTRTVGWTTPDGASISLGDAFDAVATKAQKDELATKSGGSATNAFKVKTVSDKGYKKN